MRKYHFPNSWDYLKEGRFATESKDWGVEMLELDVLADTEGGLGFEDESDIITIPEVFCVIVVV